MNEKPRKSEIVERLFHRMYPVMHNGSSVGDIMATAALLADMLIAYDVVADAYGRGGDKDKDAEKVDR